MEDGGQRVEAMRSRGELELGPSTVSQADRVKSGDRTITWSDATHHQPPTTSPTPRNCITRLAPFALIHPASKD